MIGVLSLVLCVGAALTSSPAPADTGAGPYYAEPSWDRTLPSAGRFLVLTNMAGEAVLDRETGLVWEKTPQTAIASWNGARVGCIDKKVGGRKGWRLPSIPELTSLIDPNVTPGPTLPPGHPFTTGATGVQADNYWSATTNPAVTAGAWLVDFGGGSVSSTDKAFVTQFWCVRGGMNADQY